MRYLLYHFSRLGFVSTLIIIFIITQVSYSQDWVRKVDGFSMWSIAKDYAGNIYAGTSGSARGIFKSTDGGETWTNVYSTGTSNYLYIACDSLNNVYVANVSNGVIYSTDGGQNFTTIPASTFGGHNINSVACGKNGHIFVGATGGGVWRSTDFGATFTNTGLQTFSIVEIKVDRFNADIIYAGSSSTTANGFFISTDGGATFGNATLSTNVWEILQSSDNIIYAATTSSPYPFNKSTDGGLTWNAVGNQTVAIRGGTLDLLDNIYLAGNGGVFKSTYRGATFVNHNLTYSSNEMLTFGNKIMVCVSGTTNGGVWVYTDTTIIPVELTGFTATANNGSVELNWTTATELNNSGFEVERSVDKNNFEKIGFVPGFGTTSEKRSYSFVDNKVSNGKYFYKLKQIDLDGSYKYSDIVEANVVQLLTYSLEQNYPNPFNPTTKIKFTIPDVALSGVEGSLVSLKVYDVLGNEVATLVNEYKPAGSYEVEFNGHSDGGQNLSSGIYFYTLQSGSFFQTRKMILMK